MHLLYSRVATPLCNIAAVMEDQTVLSNLLEISAACAAHEQPMNLITVAESNLNAGLVLGESENSLSRWRKLKCNLSIVYSLNEESRIAFKLRKIRKLFINSDEY